jgi:hypothetical protein
LVLHVLHGLPEGEGQDGRRPHRLLDHTARRAHPPGVRPRQGLVGGALGPRDLLLLLLQHRLIPSVSARRAHVRSRSGARHEPAGRRTYDDGLEDGGVVAEELDHPGEHAGGGVAGGEDDADHVVGDLGVGERLAVVQEGGQEVAPALPLALAPGLDDVGHDGAQALAGLHGLVEQGARQVHGHRVVPLLQGQVALLQLLYVPHLFLAEDGQQCHIQRVLQAARRGR